MSQLFSIMEYFGYVLYSGMILVNMVGVFSFGLQLRGKTT